MFPIPDLGLLQGEGVTVITRTEVGRDPGNSPIWADVEQVVDNVLVSPGPRADVIESNRPEGVDVVYTLGFPKTLTGSLRGCRVRVRGEAFHVVGDPRPGQDNLTPGPWNRVVEVERRDG